MPEETPKPPTYPYVPLTLIEYLDTLFPDKCPKVDTPDRQIWVEVGQRVVIEHLRYCYEQINESSAEETHVTRV